MKLVDKQQNSNTKENSKPNKPNDTTQNQNNENNSISVQKRPENKDQETQ